MKMAYKSPFGAQKFFSVLFGGVSPFLSLVGPNLWDCLDRVKLVL